MLMCAVVVACWHIVAETLSQALCPSFLVLVMVAAELLQWGAPLGLCLANLLLAFNSDIHQKEARVGGGFAV